MKKLVWIIGILVTCFSLNAQKEIFLTLSPKNAGVDLQLNTAITNLNGLVFNLDHFDYYVSGVSILHDGGQTLTISDTVFLVEPNNPVLHLGNHPVTIIEQITFSVGVPMNLNTINGADAIDISAYPENHPLSFQDPSMHWGWTSGYMHMIIGGQADSNNDGVVDALFELHNLGNGNYNTVQLPVIQTDSYENQIDIFMNCNVDQWIKNIPIATAGVKHGTNGINADIMDNILTEPVFNQPQNASIAALNTTIGNLFFSETGEELTVSWKDVKGANSYLLISNSGQIVSKGSVDALNGSLTFQSISNGMYIFQLFDKSNEKLNSLKIAK